MFQKSLEKKDSTIGILSPQYETEGIVSSTETAKGLVREANLKMPRPSNPEANLDNWKRVIDLLDVEVISNLGREIEDYDISKCFKSLSIKLDEDTPFEIEDDILNIKIGPEIENHDERVEHIVGVMKHAIDVLPPVTASLIGGFLCEVRVYEKDNYYENILPDDKKFGGLNKPYRRAIEVTNYCSGRIHKNPDTYPCKSSSFSCVFLHELGHVVHNIYGFLRPGDGGYEYPSQRDELESTGCISPINLSERQANFVYDVFRSYVYNRRDCYQNIHRRKYGHTHPVEAFACAFEKLVRNGGEEIVEEYPQFRDVFTHLV